MFTPGKQVLNSDNNTRHLVVRLTEKAHRSLLNWLQGVRLSHSEAWVSDWAGVVPGSGARLRCKRLKHTRSSSEEPDRASSFRKCRRYAALEQIASMWCDHSMRSSSWDVDCKKFERFHSVYYSTVQRQRWPPPCGSDRLASHLICTFSYSWLAASTIH